MCEKFSFGVQKIQRGQVWYVDEPEDITKVLRENGSKALNGRRPYFVVNVNGIMVNCIPLTTNTVGSDNRSDDIIFSNPTQQIESRLVISQITTKGVNEFAKYLYTFDNDAIKEIMSRIKKSLFNEKDTTQFPKEKNDILEKEEPEQTSIAEIKTLPGEIEQFELRLKQYFMKSANMRKTEPMCRTQREAIIFLENYAGKGSDELSAIFGVNKPIVYRMRTKAKEAAYRRS
jgi:hypothetical protein